MSRTVGRRENFLGDLRNIARLRIAFEFEDESQPEFARLMIFCADSLLRGLNQPKRERSQICQQIRREMRSLAQERLWTGTALKQDSEEWWIDALSGSGEDSPDQRRVDRARVMLVAMIDELFTKGTL